LVAKRIIPCLDVKDGRVVKGVNFVNLKEAGDPLELALYYDQCGADELVLLDISAGQEGRKTGLKIVQKIAENITIPLIVGGGINSLDDIKSVLQAGVAKVSLNTAAVLNPEFIKKAGQVFGSQRILIAIDAKFNSSWGTWEVYTHGGTRPTGRKVLEWAKEVEELGAGELLLTSMDCDGRKEGFDLPLFQEVCTLVNLPVIASGGAGSQEHFLDLFLQTKASAALAASIFHYRETSIQEIKASLKAKGVAVQ